jgi:hypothetical protein
MPLLIALTVVVFVFFRTSSWENQRIRAEFSRTAQNLANEFWSRGAKRVLTCI